MIEIRLATQADDVQVGELLVRAFVASYAKKMPHVRITEQRKVDLRDTAGKRAAAMVWVADDGGKIVGTVSLWLPGSKGSEAWRADAGDLRHLAVDASVKGQGVSGRLIAAAENEARARGAKAMCLHVRRGAVGVAGVYSRRGYQRYPEGDLDLLPDVFLEAMILMLGE